MINEKDLLIKDLSDKINQLDSNVENYEDNLNEIRRNYDKNILEYVNTIGKKNEEIKILNENHTKEIKDVYRLYYFFIILLALIFFYLDIYLYLIY